MRSDSELVNLARAGDKSAFGELIKRHQPLVQRILLRLVRNAQLAQDLTQESLLQAYLSLDHLRDDARFQSWLYGIALNVGKSHLRQSRMDFLSLESLLGGMRVDPAFFYRAAPDPAVVVEERELHRLILDAVNELSARNRAATLLFYYDQLTVGEIAALLDVSSSAVKVRLHRSREQLKAKLISLYPEFDRTLEVHKRRGTMVKVTVVDVVQQKLEEEDTATVVVLLDEAGKRLLPIWVGPFEGWSIATSLLGHTPRRPLTFTLMANILEATGVELESVVVSALEQITFYATVKLRVGDEVREIDARPSDAINLAVHAGCPIYVAETVLEATGVDISQEEMRPRGAGLETFRQFLEGHEKKLEERLRDRAELTEEERQAQADASRKKLLALVMGTEVEGRRDLP